MSSNIEIKPIEDPNAKEQIKFKLVIIGDSGVGKTNLVQRFINDTFTKDTKATVGVEFMTKNYLINDKICKIEIWDTAGQERYKSIAAAYYKGAKGALIVYDVTDERTFVNIDKWYNEIKEKSSKDINVMLIGNKTDLTDSIEVTTDMGISKATALELPVMETSALDSKNVKEAFYKLLEEIYKTTNGIIGEEGKDGNLSSGVNLNSRGGESKFCSC